MRITVIGAGYVGLVTAACFAELGNEVVCLDRDKERIRFLESGGVPIYEPGLDALIQRNLTARRIRFTTNTELAVSHGQLQFIAVGTPSALDGSADLSHVVAAARSIGLYMTESKIVVDKSTVPVGTADVVRNAILSELEVRGSKLLVHVVSNPEFLKEGAAINDFMHPDRVVIGSDSEHATNMLRALYEPFMRNHERLIIMDVRSAELTKYAANAMLATRISFMNEIANLAERVGADIEQVRRGIGSDSRIGYSFLYAGTGYGGSCFPKDVKALLKTGIENGLNMDIVSAVERVNERQKQILVEKLISRIGEDLTGRTIAVWGLAFKPNTDDMREAPSLVLIAQVLARGANVVAFDPVAIGESKIIFGDELRIRYAQTPMDALNGADALVILTEWREFRSPNFKEMRERLKHPIVFDGRNLYDPATVVSAGIEYFSIGRLLTNSHLIE